MIHGYARVSTAGQDLAGQVAQLEAAGCDRIWTETLSGLEADRPVLAELLAYARRGDVIVVVALDRLGRSVHHLVTLAAELEDQGIELRSLRDAIDTTTPTGRFFFAVIAALAELEAGIRRDRQEAAWAAGKQRGRRPSLTAAQVATARRLRGEGKTWEEAAASIGAPRSTVQRAVERAAAVEALPPASWTGPAGVEAVAR